MHVVVLGDYMFGRNIWLICLFLGFFGVKNVCAMNVHERQSIVVFPKRRGAVRHRRIRAENHPLYAQYSDVIDPIIAQARLYHRRPDALVSWAALCSWLENCFFLESTNILDVTLTQEQRQQLHNKLSRWNELATHIPSARYINLGFTFVNDFYHGRISNKAAAEWLRFLVASRIAQQN